MPLVKLHKLDGALAITLPDEFVQAHDLAAGEYIYLGKEGANLVIKQNDPRVADQVQQGRDIIAARRDVLTALSWTATTEKKTRGGAQS
jgi:antitoxin component of MazEF toxin-antitoxin module